MKRVGRILAVIALSLCFGLTAETEHGTRTGQKTGHERPGTSRSTWAQWERVRNQYRVISKTSRKALAAQIVATHPLDILPTLEGPDGIALARGLSAYASTDATRIAGHRSDEIEGILGWRGRDEIIHRDDLVLL